MKNTETLRAQLALSNPEAATRLTNTLRIGALAVEFKETIASRELPEISARKVAKVLRNDTKVNLLIKNNASGMKNMIRTVYVQQGESTYPIAFEVKFPYSGYSEREKALFEESILLATGYKIIPTSKEQDIRLSGSYNARFKDKFDKGLWITPEAFYSTIAHFADALPISTYLSSAKAWL